MLRNPKKPQQSGGNFDGHVYGWNNLFNHRTLFAYLCQNRKQKNKISFEIVVMSLSDNINYMFCSAILN